MQRESDGDASGYFIALRCRLCGSYRLRMTDSSDASNSPDDEIAAGRFQCSNCDQWHDLRDLTIGFRLPDLIAALSDEEFAERVEVNDETQPDLCILDEEHFFIRGVLRLPIRGADFAAEFGVWSTLSEANFELVGQRWTDPARVEMEPMFGWLMTQIPLYAEPTEGLKLNVIQQPVGKRPEILIQEGQDHRIVRAIEHGVPLDDWIALIEPRLHGG